MDSHRPDAFTMETFTGQDGGARREDDYDNREGAKARRREGDLQPVIQSPEARLVPALRRYRPPVPARVSVVDGRPVQVRAARAGVAGGAIEMMAGPWRCSGEWWALDAAWDHDEWDVALAERDDLPSVARSAEGPLVRRGCVTELQIARLQIDDCGCGLSGSAPCDSD